MRRTVVLLDSNGVYLKRITDELNGRLGSNVKAHSFTNPESAVRMIKEIGADIFVTGEEFSISKAEVPQGCSYAVFTNSNSTFNSSGIRTICRYRKADLIVQDILTLDEEQKTDSAAGATSKADRGGGVFTFVSCGGGAGSSTVAAAFSVFLASGNNRVIHINVERYGSAELYFEGEGSLTMTDVVYAIRGGKSDLVQRVEEAIRCDETGVHYIEPFGLAQEISELRPDDIKELLRVVNSELHFDYVVIDADLNLESADFEVFKRSDALVIVSEGSDAAVGKFERIMNSVDVAFAREDATTPAMFLLYNKFSNKTGRNVNTRNLPLLGGIPRYEGTSSAGIVRTIARSDVFSMLV